MAARTRAPRKRRRMYNWGAKNSAASMEPRTRNVKIAFWRSQLFLFRIRERGRVLYIEDEEACWA
jgi:hypothetical protein